MYLQDLLREVEPLSFQQRFAHMVELGRRSLLDVELATTLHAMQQGDFYARLLALQACFGSRDGAYVLQAITDPSLIIQKQALHLVPLACTPFEVCEALEHATFALRVSLLRYVRRQGFLEQVDAFLESLVQRDDQHLGALLPYASIELVQRYIAQAVQRFSFANWCLLARWQPDLTLELLREAVDAADDADPLLVQRINRVLPILVRSRPAQLLKLVTVLRRIVPLAQITLQPLIQALPREMVDLLLSSNEPVALDLTPVLRRLPFALLAELVKRRHYALNEYHSWMPYLKVAQRLTLYVDYLQYWRDGDGLMPEGVIRYLPQEQREREGRLYWESPDSVGDNFTARYAAFLPWDEALTRLQSHLHATEIFVRGVALQALASNMVYHGEHLGDLLYIFLDHRNESDELRRLMFWGLQSASISIWQAEHMSQLALLVRATLDAPDLSPATVGALIRLLVRLVPLHPIESARLLALIMHERGDFPGRDLDRYLVSSAMLPIESILQPVLQDWVDLEQVPALMQLARNSGRYLRIFDALANCLEAVLFKVRDRQKAEEILLLLIRWRPAQVALLIPRLLQSDASWLLLESVYTYLHRRRQDLLTPFLARRTIQGRFSPVETLFILPLKDAFWRWTPTQQAIFAQMQEQILAEPRIDNKLKAAAVKRLAALPAIVPLYLMQQVQHAERKMRSIALIALARVDAGQGIPILLEALKGEDARVAIHAFARLLKIMPERQMFAILRSVSLEDPRVAKEVMHLLGRLHLEEAYQELLRHAARDLHPEVRLALLKVLWKHLERAETWVILEQAAQDARGMVIASLLLEVPTERLTRGEQKRLLTLLGSLLADPNPEVRIQLLEHCYHLRLADREQILTPQLLQALRSPFTNEDSAALTVFLGICTERDAPLAQQIFAAILSDWQKLAYIVELVIDRAQSGWYKHKRRPIRRQHSSLIRALVAACSTDPSTVNLRVDLVMATFTLHEMLAFIHELVATGELHAESLMHICRSLEEGDLSITPEDIIELEQSLSNQSDERLRRIALSALIQRASQWHDRSWDPTALASLRRYQHDSSPLVSAKARFSVAY